MRLCAYLIFIIFLGSSAHICYAATEDRLARESAIDIIVVPLFAIELDSKTNEKILKNKKVWLQKQLIEELNSKSYLEAVGVNEEISIEENKNIIKDTARESGADGIIAGVIKDDALKIAMRTGQSGRVLRRWTIPLYLPINDDNLTKLLHETVQTIVNGLPYRGFVTAVKGDQIKINIGKRQAIGIGTKLKIFEFQSKKPTFGSDQKQLGTVEITKIANQAAIGKVKSKNPIPLYAKVAFEDKNTTRSTYTESNRYHEGFWLHAGTRFLYLDSQLSATTGTIGQRHYQLSLTPFIEVGGGHGPFALDVQVGSAKNTSATVNFLLTEATYEIIPVVSDRWTWTTSVGAAFSNYTAANVDGAAFPLVSTTSYWPIVQEFVQYGLSPRARVFAGVDLHYPIYSKDEIHGAGSLFASYGFRAQAGLRVDLSERFGLESAIGQQLHHYEMSAGAIEETQFGVSFRALVLF